MFKKDIDLIQRLHEKYRVQPPLLDAGGLESPVIADYEISINKAIRTAVTDSNNNKWEVNIPHPNQTDRYINIRRPWEFIDREYVILNLEYGGPLIEELPVQYNSSFNTVIMVSVFEHVNNP